MSKLRTYLEEWDITLLNSDLDEIRDIVLEEAGFKWIPVSDRLPENGYGCLVTTVELYVTFGWYQSINNSWYVEGDYTEVLAWMPLPEPYDPKP